MYYKLAPQKLTDGQLSVTCKIIRARMHTAVNCGYWYNRSDDPRRRLICIFIRALMCRPLSEDQRRRRPAAATCRIHSGLTRPQHCPAAVTGQKHTLYTYISRGPVRLSPPRSFTLTTVVANIKSKCGIKVCEKRLSLLQYWWSRGSISSRNCPVMLWSGLSSNAHIQHV